MESLKNFIVENWQFISAALVVVLEILILVFRKKKVIIEKGLLTNFYTQAIQFIKEAEDIYKSGHGDKKLDYVVQRLKEMYPSLTQALDKDTVAYNSFSSKDIYSSIVEELLSLPQKKGVNDGKK